MDGDRNLIGVFNIIFLGPLIATVRCSMSPYRSSAEVLSDVRCNLGSVCVLVLSSSTLWTAHGFEDFEVKSIPARQSLSPGY